MSEIHPSYENLKNPYSGIRFEPAQHQLIGTPEPGKPRFNPEVSKRLSLYQPQILAIDGAPNTLGLGIGDESDTRFVQDVIPGPIETTYGKNEYLYVIGGDNIETAASTQFAQPTTDEKYLSEAKERLNTEMLATLPELYTKPGIYAGVLLSGLVINNLVSKPETKISRRNFLKGSAKALAASGAAALMAQVSTPFLGTLTTTEESRNDVLKTLDVLDTLLEPTKQKIINGRTAVQIAQIQDTIDHLSLPKNTAAATVMGFMHSFNANQLLTDQTERDSAIRQLYKIHQQATIIACQQLNFSPQETYMSVNKYLPQLFEQVDILKISTKKPHTLVNMGTFDSPQIHSVIQTVIET